MSGELIAKYKIASVTLKSDNQNCNSNYSI